jgi:hypothetical protein
LGATLPVETGLRCTFGTTNAGAAEPSDGVGEVAGWLGAPAPLVPETGVEFATSGATTEKDAGALPPDGFEALIT